MFRMPWAPVMSRHALDMGANPQNARQPEAVPWILYDTQTYTSASTTTLTFFSSTNSDKTLSNMEASGQLPDPQYLVLHWVTCDVLVTPIANAGHAAAAAGVLNDIDLLMKGGRSTFTLSISNKQYGPFPLRACHSLGGATGVGFGTFTAEAAITQGNNGIPGSGGFPFLGAIIIPPKVGFSITCNWSAAQTLSADAKIAIGLAGILYRRVL